MHEQDFLTTKKKKIFRVFVKKQKGFVKKDLCFHIKVFIIIRNYV